MQNKSSDSKQDQMFWVEMSFGRNYIFKKGSGTSSYNRSSSRNHDQIDPSKILYIITKMKLHDTLI